MLAWPDRKYRAAGTYGDIQSAPTIFLQIRQPYYNHRGKIMSTTKDSGACPQQNCGHSGAPQMPFYIVWSHCVGVGFCQSLSILWKQCARVDLSEDLTHFSSLLLFLFWLRTPRILSFASKYLLNMSPSTAVGHWGLSCINSMDFFCALFFPK